MSNIKIVSKRLSLRPIEESDLSNIHILHSLPETDQFNTLGIPKDIQETKSIILPWIAEHNLDVINTYTFAIEDILKGTFIGLFGLKLGSKKYRRAEVWYKIHPNFWGKGYATESLKVVIGFAFDTLHLHRVEAGCAVDNMASIRVLEKAGMVREGRRRQILPLQTGWSDNFEYAILETDYRLNK